MEISIHCIPGESIIQAIKRAYPLRQCLEQHGVKVGRKNTFSCLFHDDKQASAEYFPDTDQWRCYAGCTDGKNIDVIDTEARIRGISNREVIPMLANELGLEPEPPKTAFDWNTAKVEREHIYTDKDYNPIAKKVLLRDSSGSRMGQYLYPVNGAWVKGGSHVPKPIIPLYKLPELLQGFREGKQPLFVVEGEKDVETLLRIGLLTTTAGGASNFWKTHHVSTIPPGIEVIVLPDNDDPGKKLAKDTADKLIRHGCRVKILNLPGLSTKGDVSDWLAAGHTKEELLLLTAESNTNNELNEWPELLPLKESELKPVEELPKAIIPDAFRPWLTDIAYRMQCPLDFVAIGAMVAVSSIVGAGCAIRPKKNDDWTVIPNLWGGIIGRPSMLKTPSLSEAMKPINKLEALAKEEFELLEQYAAADNEIAKATKTAITADITSLMKGKAPKNGKTLDVLREELASLSEVSKTIRRRYKTSDVTVEKLGELLNENSRGILIFRDELHGLLNSWEREDRQGDRAFFLEAWNGNSPYITDRLGRGTIDIKNCCVSILGGIQPSKLSVYLLQAVNGLQNDGMIQRFQLLVYPNEPKHWELIDEKPNKEARNKACEVFEKLADMDFIKAGANEEEERPYFRFNEDAQKVFYEWLTDLQGKLTKEENPLMCEHLAKYSSLMPSLALIIHLVGVADGGSSGNISKEAAGMAAAWCDYLEGHARRIYGLINDSGSMAVIALSKKILQGDIQDGFTIRDIYRNGWHLLDTKEQVKAACDELIEMGWIMLKVVAVDNRPRPQEKYFINPKLRKKS